MVLGPDRFVSMVVAPFLPWGWRVFSLLFSVELIPVLGHLPQLKQEFFNDFHHLFLHLVVLQVRDDACIANLIHVKVALYRVRT